MNQSVIFKTTWGWVGLSASARGIRTIILPKTLRRTVERALQQALASFNGNLPILASGPAPGPEKVLREAQAQVTAYLAGRHRSLDFSVDLSGGTPFQRRVWRAALRIPYGRVRSYQWVATKLGGKRYARAVGTALGANPVPLVVPCHRVLAHDGSLGGFSGGLHIKRKLLRLEGTLSLLAQKAKVKRKK